MTKNQGESNLPDVGKITDEKLTYLQDRALFCRLETIRLISIAKVGHYTSVFSCAEIFTALYYDTMRIRPGDPTWNDRDRFTMGKGHAAVGLYPILADLGFFDKILLDSYTKLGSPLGDHPDMRKVPGIDFSSGSIGHAISGALGMILAGRKQEQDFHVFTLVGDGEMQEGQVWEAAMSAAHHKTSNLIVIIDRNGYQLDGRVDDIIGVEDLEEKWTAFGWEVHRVNGHDMMMLANLLRQVRNDKFRTRPCCIIADTVKGKGIGYMETEPGWHLGYLAPPDEARAIQELKQGPIKAVPLSKDSWQYREINVLNPGLQTLADGLSDLVESGHAILACTADLQYSNGLSKFAKKHPERFIQFGISEQNMVSAAAGIAATGSIPFVATFASFLALLCCEQIRTDVAYSGLPVRLVGHHSGISLGFYGTSHHATEDLAIMRSIADLTVVAPADNVQLSAAIAASANYPQPIYFRIGRGRDPDIYKAGLAFEFGKAINHGIGEDMTIIATGSMVHPSLAAVKILRSEGRSIGLLDIHTIKPLDRAAILKVAEKSQILMTVEEHNIIGGLGGAVAETLADEGIACRLIRHGIKDEFSLIAPPTHLYAHYRLDAKGIVAISREAMG